MGRGRAPGISVDLYQLFRLGLRCRVVISTIIWTLLICAFLHQELVKAMEFFCSTLRAFLCNNRWTSTSSFKPPSPSRLSHIIQVLVINAKQPLLCSGKPHVSRSPADSISRFGPWRVYQMEAPRLKQAETHTQTVMCQRKRRIWEFFGGGNTKRVMDRLYKWVQYFASSGLVGQSFEAIKTR